MVEIMARWIFSIVKALEARKEWIKDFAEANKEEEKYVEEVLQFFENVKQSPH